MEKIRSGTMHHVVALDHTVLKDFYLYRNPEDTVVSWHCFQPINNLDGIIENVDQFLTLFGEDKVSTEEQHQTMYQFG